MKISTKTYWLITVVAAFAAMISYFQIGSYGADKNNTNTLFLILGIVFTIIALFSVYQVAKKWGSSSK